MKQNRFAKKALVGTLAGMMVAAAPFAAFAAEEKPETKTAVEAAAETELETEAEKETETEQNALDFESFVAELEEMDLDTAVEAMENMFVYLGENPEAKTDFVRAILDTTELDLSDEEKDELAEMIGGITLEDVEEFFSSAVEFFSDEENRKAFEEELDAVLEEEAQRQYQESLVELDQRLEDLGQLLIDITPEDIMAFLS